MKYIGETCTTDELKEQIKRVHYCKPYAKIYGYVWKEKDKENYNMPSILEVFAKKYCVKIVGSIEALGVYRTENIGVMALDTIVIIIGVDDEVKTLIDEALNAGYTYRAFYANGYTVDQFDKICVIDGGFYKNNKVYINYTIGEKFISNWNYYRTLIDALQKIYGKSITGAVARGLSGNRDNNYEYFNLSIKDGDLLCTKPEKESDEIGVNIGFVNYVEILHVETERFHLYIYGRDVQHKIMAPCLSNPYKSFDETGCHLVPTKDGDFTETNQNVFVAFADYLNAVAGTEIIDTSIKTVTYNKNITEDISRPKPSIWYTCSEDYHKDWALMEDLLKFLDDKDISYTKEEKDWHDYDDVDDYVYWLCITTDKVIICISEFAPECVSMHTESMTNIVLDEICFFKNKEILYNTLLQWICYFHDKEFTLNDTLKMVREGWEEEKNMENTSNVPEEGIKVSFKEERNAILYFCNVESSYEWEYKQSFESAMNFYDYRFKRSYLSFISLNNRLIGNNITKYEFENFDVYVFGYHLVTINDIVKDMKEYYHTETCSVICNGEYYPEYMSYCTLIQTIKRFMMEGVIHPDNVIADTFMNHAIWYVCEEKEPNSWLYFESFKYSMHKKGYSLTFKEGTLTPRNNGKAYEVIPYVEFRIDNAITLVLCHRDLCEVINDYESPMDKLQDTCSVDVDSEITDLGAFVEMTRAELYNELLNEIDEYIKDYREHEAKVKGADINTEELNLSTISDEKEKEEEEPVDIDSIDDDEEEDKDLDDLVWKVTHYDVLPHHKLDITFAYNVNEKDAKDMMQNLQNMLDNAIRDNVVRNYTYEIANGTLVQRTLVEKDKANEDEEN